MRVLVACEFSGRVRDAFIREGHDAISVDFLASESSFGPHYRGDIFEFLALPSTTNNAQPYDLMIAHPPCTYLAVSGNRWFKDRQQEQQDALDFVRRLLNTSIPKIALENPVSVISSCIRKPDQVRHPWMFGSTTTKATCLWLKGLPRLQPTHITSTAIRYQDISNTTSGLNRSKNRSRTFEGIARAMAEQWGSGKPGLLEWNRNTPACIESWAQPPRSGNTRVPRKELAYQSTP